jgi:hypothetical protein
MPKLIDGDEEISNDSANETSEYFGGVDGDKNISNDVGLPSCIQHRRGSNESLSEFALLETSIEINENKSKLIHQVHLRDPSQKNR